MTYLGSGEVTLVFDSQSVRIFGIAIDPIEGDAGQECGLAEQIAGDSPVEDEPGQRKDSGGQSGPEYARGIFDFAGLVIAGGTAEEYKKGK